MMNQYLDSPAICVNPGCQFSRLITSQFEFKQHEERRHKIIQEEEFYKQIEIQLQQDLGYFEDNLLIDFKDILNENEVKIKDIIYDYIGELYLIVKREIQKYCTKKYKQQQTLIEDLPLDKQFEFLSSPPSYLQSKDFQQIIHFFEVKLKSAKDLFMQHFSNQLLDFEYIFAITKPQPIQINQQSIQMINIDAKPNNLFQPIIQNLDYLPDKVKINKSVSNMNRSVQTEQLKQKSKEVQTEFNQIQMNEQLIQKSQSQIDTLEINQRQLTKQNQDLIKVIQQLELKQLEQEKLLTQFKQKEQLELAQQQKIQLFENEQDQQKQKMKLAQNPFALFLKQSNAVFDSTLSDGDVICANSQISVQNSLAKLIFKSTSRMSYRMIKFSIQQNPIESTYFQIKIGMINLNNEEECTTMNKTGQIFQGKKIQTQIRDINLLSHSLIQMEIVKSNVLQITGDNQPLVVQFQNKIQKLTLNYALYDDWQFIVFLQNYSMTLL